MLTLNATKYIGNAIIGTRRTIHHGIPVAKLATIGAYRFQRDQRVITLKFFRKTECRWRSGVDSLRASLQFLSDIVRDEVVMGENFRSGEGV